MKTIGILALQGAFKEHAMPVKKLGHLPREVKRPSDLEGLDGIILPGGESTAISNLLDSSGLRPPLTKILIGGLPCMGTCAGMILLAKKVEHCPVPTLNMMNITVKRNAYGRQLGSFSKLDLIPSISDKAVSMVFIRAPYVSAAEDTVEIIHRVNDQIVAVREKNFLALSFHPELTEDLSFHQYWINSF